MRIFVTLAFCSLFPLTLTAQNQPVDSLHKQAYALLDTDLDSAIVVADLSISIAQQAGYDWGEANGYYIKGYAYRQKKHLSNALKMYLKAAAILEGLKDGESAKKYTSILLNSGGILTDFYQYQGALELYDKGLELTNAWDLPVQKQKLLYNKAYCLRKKGDQKQAGDVLKQAAKLAYDLQDNSRFIRCWNLFGLIHKDGKFYDMAREYYAYILSSPNAKDKDRARAFHNLAVTYKEEGSMDSAQVYFEKALVLKRQLNDPELLISTLTDLTEYYLENNELTKAESYGLESVQLYPELLASPESFEVFHLLDTLYYAKQSYDQSQMYGTRFYQETKLFIEEQQAIIEQLKYHQMELVLNAFEAEQKAQAQETADRRIIQIQALVIAICLILFIFIYFKWKFLKRKIQDIMNWLAQ